MGGTIYIYIKHTNVHTYMHTYIRTYVHTYMRTYVQGMSKLIHIHTYICHTMPATLHRAMSGLKVKSRGIHYPKLQEGALKLLLTEIPGLR